MKMNDLLSQWAVNYFSVPSFSKSVIRLIVSAHHRLSHNEIYMDLFVWSEQLKYAWEVIIWIDKSC